MALIQTQIVYCRPFLKWAGGKTRLLPTFDRFIPDHFENYFEPFLGGAAMFFHLASKREFAFRAYLSDINPELTNVYEVVQSDVENLITSLERHSRKYLKNPLEYYYQLRDQSRPRTQVERAARLITLNRTCFNGLYRINKRGKFNVPFGGYTNPLICNTENLRAASMALQKTAAVVESASYEKTLERASEGDFVYLDPPYKPVSQTAAFTEYTGTAFVDKDQQKLSEVFRALDRKKCKVMLSNSFTTFTRRLYSEYSLQVVMAPRFINCKGSGRGNQKEILIRNY